MSEAYLAGEGSPEWLPLRSGESYDDLDVEVRLETPATGLSAEDRLLECGDQTLAYDKLLLATGGRPSQLELPVVELDGIYLLRSHQDCDAIIDKADKTSRTVGIGASFIGMHAAAARRTCGLDVDIV